VHQWIRKAAGDLAAAEHLLRGGGPDLLLGAAFHAQQAAEKFLKAALVWHQIEFAKTHDIDHLVDLVRTVDAHVAGLVCDAAALTPYGVDARYPSDLPEPSPEEARRAVALAERVRQAVLQHLPAEFGLAGSRE
jgi:HEPN domain-containing protein